MYLKSPSAEAKILCVPKIALTFNTVEEKYLFQKKRSVSGSPRGRGARHPRENRGRRTTNLENTDIEAKNRENQGRRPKNIQKTNVEAQFLWMLLPNTIFNRFRVSLGLPQEGRNRHFPIGKLRLLYFRPLLFQWVSGTLFGGSSGPILAEISS